MALGTPTAILGGTAAVGFLMAAWGRIKVYLFKIYSLLIETVRIEDKRLYFAVANFLLSAALKDKLYEKKALGLTKQNKALRAAAASAAKVPH